MRIGSCLAVLWLIIPATGCAASKQLTQSRAKELIQAAPKLNEPRETWIMTGEFGPSSGGIPFAATVSHLVKLGLLATTSAPGHDTVTFTSRGLDARKSWKLSGPGCPAEDQPGQQCWRVPLAVEKVDRVAIKEGGKPSETDVRFDWHWELTDIGKETGEQVDSNVHHGIAELSLYDDGWRVEQLETDWQ